MRKYILFFLLSVAGFAVNTFTPIDSIEINGTAKDMVLHGNNLVVATDMGHIEIYDTVKNEKIKEISIPDVKDFMGDIMPARVMSNDEINGIYLLLSDSGKGGYSNLYIYKDEKLIQLITPEDKEAIIKARFVDETHILLGYLSDEVSLFDMQSKKELYRTQLSESKFSDFMLNEKHTKAIFSCESGVLSVVDIKSGQVIEELQGQNVDNVYKVDFKADTVSGAGQDRRGSLYDVKTKKGTYIEGEFLIYATALSPTASKVAFAMDEKNNISIYNTSGKSKIALLKGQKSTLNVIIFKDENVLFSASDDNTIMVWNLNKK
jgi:WD40 repeat protein